MLHKEMFCHLKDKLELYKDHLLLNLMCYSCNCSGHVVKNCPEVHYIPKPDLVIKAQLEIEKKARKEFKRRTKKYQAKIQVPLILTSAYAIRNTMFLYHEEGIKERYRVEDDMNDFLEENPKGMESLAKKIVNYKEANAFQAEKSNVRFEVQNLISKTLEEDMEQNDEEEYLKSLHSLKKPQKVIEYDAFFNDFERIDIFTKYFIHNNFTIIKKKLTHELTIKMNEKKRRQSFQKKVQLLKSKTIRPGKKIEVSEDDPSASGLPEEFKMDIVTMDLKVGFKDFSENLNRQELKDPNSRELFETSPSILALNNNYSTLKFENSKTKKNLNKKTTKRASSVETAKECEKFIEKFGAENVYKLVKDKIDKKE